MIPQDQGLTPALGECRKQLIALKTFVIIIIIMIIIIIIIIIVITRIIIRCCKDHYFGSI